MLSMRHIVVALALQASPAVVSSRSTTRHLRSTMIPSLDTPIDMTSDTVILGDENQRQYDVKPEIVSSVSDECGCKCRPDCDDGNSATTPKKPKTPPGKPGEWDPEAPPSPDELKKMLKAANGDLDHGEGGGKDVQGAGGAAGVSGAAVGAASVHGTGTANARSNDPANQACPDLKTCGSCMANLKCGWCGASETCMDGNEVGPAVSNGTDTTSTSSSSPLPTCEDGWNFSGECDGRTCADHATCGTCLQDHVCGWCEATMSCREGSSKESMPPTCPSTSWMTGAVGLCKKTEGKSRKYSRPTD